MSLISRAKSMILSPASEWTVVATEEPNAMGVFMGYVVPWIIIDAICAFIGHGIIWGGGHYGGAAMSWGMFFAVTTLFGQGLSVWVASAIINMLAPSFGSEKNMGRAMQTVAYSSSAMYLGKVLAILPFIGWLGSLFGLYGIYLFYLGLPHTMKTPQDKVIVYMVVGAVVMLVVYGIIAAIFSTLLMGVFGLGVIAGQGMMGM